jgi:di/tricarboxylate transporter
MTALLALLVVSITGLVPQEATFAGFGHPAVITVAAVLVISRGLLNAGVADALARYLIRIGNSPTLQVAVLTGVVAFCSAFMNNVGALALMMPVAIRMARKSGNSPSQLLMPLAFGSLLGGMTTLIGTPPNIVISAFRTEAVGRPFQMFDFAPVGVGVALAGVLFIGLIGWRLVPQRRPSNDSDLFHIEDYITEVHVPENSNLVGKTIYDIKDVTQVDVVVLVLIRGERRLRAPSSIEIIRADDILVLEATPEDLRELLEVAKLELVGSKKLTKDMLRGGNRDIELIEVIVSADSPIQGHTAIGLNLRWRYGVNLLAVARQGERVQNSLGQIRFRVGDALLLQGPNRAIQAALPVLGLLPLAGREISLGRQPRLLYALAIFGIALITTSVGLISASVALTCAAFVMIATGLISLNEAYGAIEWPIIILLGAMIPVGQALETTGAAELLANLLLSSGAGLAPVITLTILLVATMFLSDIINNTAAAVLVAPIAIGVARGLAVSPDPFLLAVAIGASCAFLTPIGHQSSTLVMGPGGYRFGDYWRMGLPLEIIIVGVSVPLLLLFWPL